MFAYVDVLTFECTNVMTLPVVPPRWRSQCVAFVPLPGSMPIHEYFTVIVPPFITRKSPSEFDMCVSVIVAVPPDVSRPPPTWVTTVYTTPPPTATPTPPQNRPLPP